MRDLFWIKKSLLMFSVLALTAVITFGCFDGDDEDTPKDTTAPTVESTVPSDQATGIHCAFLDCKPDISVTFNESMDTSTITVNTTDTACTGTIQVSLATDNFAANTCFQWSADAVASNNNKTFTVTPSNDLSNNDTFKIRVTTDAQDDSGNALESVYTQPNGFTTEP